MSRQPTSVRFAEGVAQALRRVLPTPVLRFTFRVGYRLMGVWWFFTRPAASGCKVVVIRGDEMLFIRLTYGARETWDIPGGTAGDGETPDQTAARELYEEVGLSGDLVPLGTWTGVGRGPGAELHAFRAEVTEDAEPVLDEAEIAEARWFAIDDLPARIARGSEEIVKASIGSRSNA